jgi:hypothetical protein
VDSSFGIPRFSATTRNLCYLFIYLFIPSFLILLLPSCLPSSPPPPIHQFFVSIFNVTKVAHSFWNNKLVIRTHMLYCQDYDLLECCAVYFAREVKIVASYTFRIEAARSSETFINIYQTVRRYVLYDCNTN